MEEQIMEEQIQVQIQEQQISDLGFISAFRMERVGQEKREREAEIFLQDQFG